MPFVTPTIATSIITNDTAVIMSEDEDKKKKNKKEKDKDKDKKKDKKKKDKKKVVVSEDEDEEGSLAPDDLLSHERSHDAKKKKTKKKSSSSSVDKDKEKGGEKKKKTRPPKASKHASMSNLREGFGSDDNGLPSLDDETQPKDKASIKKAKGRRRASMNAVGDITRKGHTENVDAVMSEDEFQEDDDDAEKRGKKKKEKRGKKKAAQSQGSSSNLSGTESTKAESVSVKEHAKTSAKQAPLTASPQAPPGITAEPDGKCALHKLLDIDPFSKSHSTYNEDAITDVIFLDPASCSKKYKFECFGGEIYPFSMLCALGASNKILQMCHNAFPQASKEKDIWIGTPLHYACAYLGSIDNVKWLMDRSPGSAASMNRLRRTPFHAVCLFNPRPDILQVLIDLAPMGLQSADKDGNTALHVRKKSIFLTNHSVYLTLKSPHNSWHVKMTRAWK